MTRFALAAVAVISHMASRISGRNGISSCICSCSDSVPSTILRTYWRVCTSRTSSSVTGSGSTTSVDVMVPSASRRSRTRRYFAVGKTWAPMSNSQA